MFGDIAPRPPGLAIRPAHEAYRSMPGTPLGMDPRGANSVDLAAAMKHASLGFEGSDYFLNTPRLPPGTIRPRSPVIPVSSHEWNHDNGYLASGSMSNTLGFRERDRERDLEESIRKCVTRPAM